MNFPNQNLFLKKKKPKSRSQRGKKRLMRRESELTSNGRNREKSFSKEEFKMIQNSNAVKGYLKNLYQRLNFFVGGRNWIQDVMTERTEELVKIRKKSRQPSKTDILVLRRKRRKSGSKTRENSFLTGMQVVFHE